MYHVEFSMFGRVKCGTINASQLFFQGSHVFSIFKLKKYACNKNKITTYHYRLPSFLTGCLCCQKCSIRRSQFQRQMWDQAQNHQKKYLKKRLWDHVIPSVFYSFHFISFNVGYRLVWGYRIVSTDSKIILYLWKWSRVQFCVHRILV